jgi:hypothetical protein
MVKHLPPAVKQLLTLRNPHPYPSPPKAALVDLFTKTLLDARHRKAETGWLVLAVSPDLFLGSF